VLSLKSQVDLISYFESILLNDPYNFLTSWPRLLASLPSCSAFYVAVGSARRTDCYKRVLFT